MSSSRRDMIYDCFTFYKEMDMLEIRLNLLNDVVDKFVLLESTVTYTNQKKPLYFKKNIMRYKKFKDKIIHIVVDDIPNVSNPWLIEHYLMAASIRGLKKAKPNDIVLVSNLDEIPNPEKILKWKNKPGKLKAFEQHFFHYYLNYACINKNWVGTKMLKYKDFLTYRDAYVIRHSSNNVIIPDGGWHFSYMGGINYMLEKIATGTHQEYNNDRYNTKEKIMQAILEKKDIFGHGDKFNFVSINTLPKYLQINKNKYPEMFLLEKKNMPFKTQYTQFLEMKHFIRIMYRTLKNKMKHVNSEIKSKSRSKITMGTIDSKT